MIYGKHPQKKRFRRLYILGPFVNLFMGISYLFGVFLPFWCGGPELRFAERNLEFCYEEMLPEAPELASVDLMADSSHLKIGRAPKGNEKVFQPSIFRGELLVSGRVCLST